MGGPSTFDTDKGKLREEIDELRKTYYLRHKGNYRTSWLLILFGIIGSISVSGFALLGYAKLAGVMGLLVALCISLQTAFALGERAQFQRIIYTEAENLITRLNIRAHDADGLSKVSEELELLRKSAAENIPRGEGMGAVQKLTSELEAKRQ
jgi:hypothetical protein